MFRGTIFTHGGKVTEESRKIHDKEQYNLYPLPSTSDKINENTIGYIGGVGDVRNWLASSEGKM